MVRRIFRWLFTDLNGLDCDDFEKSKAAGCLCWGSILAFAAIAVWQVKTLILAVAISIGEPYTPNYFEHCAAIQRDINARAALRSREFWCRLVVSVIRVCG